MKKLLITTFMTAVVLGVGAFFNVSNVEAQSGTAATVMQATAAATNVVSGFAEGAILGYIAYLLNWLLKVCSWFVAVTGTFLSVSINITTHIKDLYNSAAGINSIWLTVRDISSMVIIFALLYYSILTIVGKGGKKVNEIIVSVFLAGIFINFSLFFARVGVDASNLISLHIYNAIAPGTSENLTITQAFNNGGLSNVFMNSLKLPLVYNPKVLSSADVYSGIGLAALGAIILMVTAIFSFMAAGLAFIARTGILLFCLALSPLYFAGLIFPKVKEKVSDKIMAVFKGQLIFMPVYLFLLYIALRLISDPKFSQVFNPTLTAGSDTGYLGPVTIGVIVQYTIAIIFINAPLVAAISLSGTEGALMKWAPQADKIAGTISSWTGRNYIGRPVAALDKALENTRFGNSSMGRTIRENTLGQVTSSKFYGSRSWEDQKKLNKEIKKKSREMERLKDLKIATAGGDRNEIRKALNEMTDNEIANLDNDVLKDKKVLIHLSSNVFKNIEKGEKSDKDKHEIRAARDSLLKEGDTPDNPVIKNLVKSMSGDDLVSYIEDGGLGNDGTSKNLTDELIAHLKEGQLKNMEGLSDKDAEKIGTTIMNWGATHGRRHHPAATYIGKNKSAWGVAESSGGGESGGIIESRPESPSGKRSSKNYG